MSKNNKAAKVVKQENQNDNQAPKWGTAAWIKAYPWSKMDRNRRRRIRKLLGTDCDPDNVQFTTPVFQQVMKDFARLGVKMPAKKMKAIANACDTVDKFFVTATDIFVAAMLAMIWGTEAAEARAKNACKGDEKRA